MYIITTGQSNLVRDRIAVLSYQLSRRRMHLFTVCNGQEHSPCVGRLLRAGTCPPSKAPFPVRRSAPSSETWFLIPTRVRSQKLYLDDSAVFAGFTNITNRETDTQTDHATPFVAIGRI